MNFNLARQAGIGCHQPPNTLNFIIRFWLLNALVLFLVVAASSFARADAVKGYLENTNFAGGDLESFDASDPGRCASACDANANCQAWTYIKPWTADLKGMCVLKDSVPEAASNDCCVSGLARSAKDPTVAAASPDVFLLNGLRLTVTNRREGGPEDVPVRMHESQDEIQISVENVGQARGSANINLFPVKVYRYSPDRAYYTSGARMQLPKGQSLVTKLPMKGGLIPGEWRIRFKVGDDITWIPLTVASDHPLAEPLTSEQEPRSCLGSGGNSQAV